MSEWRRCSTLGWGGIGGGRRRLGVGFQRPDEVGLWCRGAQRLASVIGEANLGRQAGVADLGLGYEIGRQFVKPYLEGPE